MCFTPLVFICSSSLVNNIFSITGHGWPWSLSIVLRPFLHYLHNFQTLFQVLDSWLSTFSSILWYSFVYFLSSVLSTWPWQVNRWDFMNLIIYFFWPSLCFLLYSIPHRTLNLQRYIVVSIQHDIRLWPNKWSSSFWIGRLISRAWYKSLIKKSELNFNLK